MTGHQWAVGRGPSLAQRAEVLQAHGCGEADIVAQVLRDPGSYHTLGECCRPEGSRSWTCPARARSAARFHVKRGRA